MVDIMTAQTTAPWQHGYDLAFLKRLAGVFKDFDAPYIHGAFTPFKEREVAQALDDGTLKYDDADDPKAVIVVRPIRQRQALKDFTGDVRATMQPGDIYVTRMAWRSGGTGWILNLLDALHSTTEDTLFGDTSEMWLNVWQESPEHRAVLPADALLAAVKIPASSELIGVYTTGPVQALPASEHWALARLDVDVPETARLAAAEALNRLPAYADHYSGYNKRHAWTALALRGYGDADNIVKPAEMSKSWKAANADLLDAPCKDTPLREALPEMEPLIALIPGDHQRIRLMRLEPGGGELTRHADIIDREAGTTTGKLLRIHIPLVTNPQVEFSSWHLDGGRAVVNMRAGEAWYLDTRKPHTAINNGDTPRVHLVIDAHSSPALIHLLERQP